MTIANNYVPIRQIGNGVTTQFSAAWSMLQASYANVLLEDAITHVQTPVTQGGGSNQYQIVITSSGFTVTFGTAPTSGQYAVIGRITGLDQLTPYTTSTGFQGPVEEASFDKLTAMVQDNANTLARALTVPLGDTATSLQLPTAAVRALQLSSYDALGNATVTAPLAGPQGPAGPSYPYAAAGGTVDALTATFSPAVTFVAGTTVVLKLAGANATTTPTLNGNSTGIKTITKKGGTALAVGDLPGANAVAILSADTVNGRWELLNPASGGGLGLPTGRLCLASGTPVQTASTLNVATIFYTPYVGNTIPINGGSTVFSELTATLDATNAVSGSVYDLFVYSDSGTIRLGYGPAWTSSTARGSGAGTTELQFTNGLWTNKNSITLRYDSTHTTAGIPAGAATYVGTFTPLASGFCRMMLNPAAGAGGSQTYLGLWNAYNRVRTTGTSQDNSTLYIYSTATWRAANASTNNRITFVDGLAQSPLLASNEVPTEASNASNLAAAIGVNLDSTSATPAITCAGGSGVSSYWSLIVPAANFPPVLGLHFVQAMEIGDTGSNNFGGQFQQGRQALTLTMDM